MRTFLLALLFPLITHSSEPLHKAGDLIFLSMPCHVCELIEKTTNSSFSHVGILDQDKEGNWVVIMAAEPQVMTVSLEYLVKLVPKAPVFMRMKDEKEVAAAAAKKAAQYLGTPYDAEYVLGTVNLYCSELVYFSFADAKGSPVFSLNPMNFSPFEKEWEKAMGHLPPQGKLGLSPGDLARSSLLEVVPQ